MSKLIEKAREASTENLMEMAILLNDATTKEARMSSMAVMVVLEERLGADQFNAFAAAID